MRPPPSCSEQRLAAASARRKWGLGLALPLMAVTGMAFAQTPAPAAALQAGTGSAERLLPFEVTVNGSKSGTWLLLARLDMLYAPRDAFEEWRLQIRDTTQAVNFRSNDYFPLAGIAGYSAKVNFGNQAIDLTFAPEAFHATRLTTEINKKPVLSPVLPSVFVNYDLNYAATAPRGISAVQDLGLLSEIGVSNAWGVLTSSQVGSNLTGNSTATGLPRGWLRLETTFTKDLPESNQTLRLGDASTRAGMWGRSVYFGGIQIGSNFALTPGFISQPSPALSGVSSAPSTVELYVNDVLRQVSNVPTGPFAINNFPALTGSGNARLVVRDLLGRETVISQPFFTSSQLLAKGLRDWSLEAGRVRLDLGTASGRYGDPFTSGTLRLGVTNEVTLEGRSEITKKNKVLGAGVVAALPFQVLAKGALVGSREESLGAGTQWLVGLEQQTLQTGMYLQVQGASINFRQLGQDASALPTKLQMAGNLSYSTERFGSFGFGFANLRRFNDSPVTTVSANYSIRIGERSNLSVSTSRAIAGVSGNSVAAILVVPLEKNIVTTASLTQRSGKLDSAVTAVQNPGLDENLGWRALAGRQQGDAQAEGGVYYTGRYGRISGDISSSRDLNALRLGAAGGLVLADGHLFVTRRVDDSFAVAEVAGYADVGIGLGSNVLTQTDASGIALIPRMMAYQTNSIRIDPRQLPVSAEIDSIEQSVVPGWRSGVKVVFPVRSGQAALVRLVLDDGEPAPAGAIVTIDGDTQVFYVARRGEAFVTGLQPSNRLQLRWNGQQCSFGLTLPAQSPDEIVRLGPLACQGVTR